MPSKKMWVNFEEGTSLSRSHKKPGHYSPLTRDGEGNLGHVTLSDLDDDEVENVIEYVFDQRSPDISSLVPMALVAVSSIAVGVASAKVLERLAQAREKRGSRRARDRASASPPAGWYETAADSRLLRYWDGRAWTNDVAQRRVASAIPADWYPDPANVAQLRFWDGSAWTHHVAANHRVAATPADWYPDPANVAQLRYWDGASWTHHVCPREGSAAVSLSPGFQPSHAIASSGSAPRVEMSMAEWQAYFHAWVAASAIEQELWRRLSNAHIKDADQVTLEAQHRMEQLTPEQGRDRIRLMLEADPSAMHGLGLTELIRFLGATDTRPLAKTAVGIERASRARRWSKSSEAGALGDRPGPR